MILNSMLYMKSIVCEHFCSFPSVNENQYFSWSFCPVSKHIFWHQTCTLLAKISPYRTSSEYKFRYMVCYYMDSGFWKTALYTHTKNIRVYGNRNIIPYYCLRIRKCCVCYTLLYAPVYLLSRWSSKYLIK